MTILDKFMQFDPNPTAITVTAISTNQLDMQQQREMFGDNYGGIFVALITILTAFTAAGAATLQVQFQASVDNATYTIIAQTDAIPKASLVPTPGIAAIALPMGAMQVQSVGRPRYYRLNYAVGTGPFTAGTMEADLVGGVFQQNGQFVPGYTPGFTVAN
jgi:hypothetical protein